ECQESVRSDDPTFVARGFRIELENLLQPGNLLQQTSARRSAAGIVSHVGELVRAKSANAGLAECNGYRSQRVCVYGQTYRRGNGELIAAFRARLRGACQNGIQQSGRIWIGSYTYRRRFELAEVIRVT